MEVVSELVDVLVEVLALLAESASGAARWLLVVAARSLWGGTLIGL